MENKVLFILILIGCILLFLAIIVGIILLLMERKEGWSDYDRYIYALSWGPASCFNKEGNKDECFERLDKLDINNSFVIHGLWPTYSSGEDIEDCNDGDDIEVNFNKEYENNLSKIWPGLISSDHEMWNNEYNTHGYCYIQRLRKNVENDYLIYFDQAKNMIGDLQYILEVILPDTPQGLNKIVKYKFKEFIEGSQLSIKPLTYSLRCVENKEKNSNMLSEIWFKYDFDFHSTSNFELTDSCGDSFDIYFRNENKIPVWKKYDFYVMTVLWNPTYCLQQGKECYKKLKEKELNIFRIHGLWPSYSNRVIPQWCNLEENVEVFNYTKDMEDYWINMYKESNKQFWEHEYNKHGYCFNQRMNVPVYNYSYYFDETVRLYYDFDMKDLMNEFYPGLFAGINSFTRQDFSRKLGEKYGNGTFTLTCTEYNGLNYLNEVRIKLNMNLSNDTIGYTSDNCPGTFYAEFLEVEGPQKQDKDLYKDYDMYFFTILWLGTTCHQKGWQCYDRIKVVPKNTFSIHGLWPNLRNGTLGEWCNGPNDIEIDIKDKTLLDYMNKHYVSGYHTNEYFWGHEYNKHGYCYNQRNNIDVNDYEKYFQKAKELFANNNFENLFLDFFEKEEIKIEVGDMPINRTKFEKFFNERGFSKDTYLIVCTNITKENETEVNPHLLEMRIRYDMDFKLFTNETDKSEFDCPEIFHVQFL